MEKKEEAKGGKSRRRWWIWVVVAVIVIAVIASAGGQEEKSGEDAGTNSAKLSDDAYTLYCQDAKWYEGKKPSNISLIYVGNLNEMVMPLGVYDKDGDEVYFAKWNGHDKATDETVPFTCYVSGQDEDNLTIHHLTMNGETIKGGPDFEAYYEDGKSWLEE